MIRNGTTYDDRTPAAVVEALEDARARGVRVRLSFGDTETGRDWNEVHGVHGRLARSMGPTRVPILLHNSASTGGGAVSTHLIVKISETVMGRVLYAHPNYHA